MSAIREAVGDLWRGNERLRLNTQARDDLRLVRHLAATAAFLALVAACVVSAAAIAWHAVALWWGMW